MRKTLVRLLILVLATLYGLVIYGWWVEGNSNYYRQQLQSNILVRT